MEKLRVTLQRSVLVMGLTLTVIPGCKTATAPQGAECGAGFLPCEDNITECCEVICPELHHHCGDFLTECCLDTTSHDFTWTIDTLGIYGSYLKDVAIIDENNIWAVGNIETDSGEYNAARWNGDQWELQGIYSNTLDLYSIWYFTVDDIWVASHCFPYHWDGNTWTQYHLNNMGMPGICAGNAIWGSSPEDIWFVGDSGSIVHYDGSGFTRMESGHDVRLIDVEGTEGGDYVFVVGYDFFSPAYSAVYQIHDGTVETLFYDEIHFPTNGSDWGAVSSVSVYEDTVYFVTYRGLWKKYIYSDESTVDPAFHNYGYRNMVVQGPNDIFTVGGGGKYAHFNGVSWDLNDEFYPDYNLSSWGSSLNGNTAVFTGYFRDGSHGYVAIGRR